jgi:DNA modification methylase
MVQTADSRRKLEISHVRTCNCPVSHINCLTAKEWIKAQIGVWQFNYEARDIRDREVHPATFPISLAKKVISLFTHKGELVLDPFVGSGTTLVAAHDLERNAVGFDLNEKYCETSSRRLSQKKLVSTTHQVVVCDDARNIAEYLEPATVSLVLTSPPYANLLNRPRLNKSRRGQDRLGKQYLKVEQYSQDSRDLGTLTVEKYAEEMATIYRSINPLLKDKGHNIINVADVWWQGKRVPIHLHIIEAMDKAGFELRNTIIWDRTNIVNRIGIFGWPSNYITMGTTFEYILDFIKQP